MPIYEYRCAQCQETFEELVFNVAEIKELSCPRCGSDKVSKLMSAFATGSAAALPCAPGPSCDPGQSCDPSGFS